ncbi:hypothetical protein BCD49_09900 [Pseudofrankia sp. EUN1h]|nr:hypothetical protein BCD49_09900 [Pseudofrankia sp. EUN1h]
MDPTAGARRVAAGWAVYGKQAGASDDYAVQRASNAYFSRADYDSILRRFGPGTPPPRASRPGAAALPWATVSYAPLNPLAGRAGGAAGAETGTGTGTALVTGAGGPGPVGPGVLGIAVRDWTDLADAAGRRVAGTTYLCAPFAALAAVAVGYQGLYEALRHDPEVAAAVGPDAVGVSHDRDTSIAVRPAPVPEPAAPAAVGDDVPGAVPLGSLAGLDAGRIADRLAGENFRLAAGIAALLLCQPVALLGASAAGSWEQVEERLGFLDAVAALLPYGQRARLVASTWADSGTEHRIRLAYTDRPRPGEAEVRFASAGRPASLPGLPFPAADYFELLVDLRERRGLPVEQIIAHLWKRQYRPAHRIADPLYALLCLADLPGPAFFAGSLLTSARARHTAQLAAAAASDRGRQRALRQRAAREDLTDTVALLRAQRARGRLLAGPGSGAQDAAVLAALAERGDGPALALELVRLAAEDDDRAVDAGRAAAPGAGPAATGTGADRYAVPAATAHTAGWLAWLGNEPAFAGQLRPFADAIAGSLDQKAFGELLRGMDPGYPLVVFRLARLAGRAQPLRRQVWLWLRDTWVERPPPKVPSDLERAWADELSKLPARHPRESGVPKEEAELDLCGVLLGTGPVEALKARMMSLYWTEYRGSVHMLFRDLVNRYGSGVAGLPILEAVMDGLAASLDSDGWPEDSYRADDTLMLLGWLAQDAMSVSPGLAKIVTRYLGAKPKPRLRHETAKTWKMLLEAYVVPRRDR